MTTKTNEFPPLVDGIHNDIPIDRYHMDKTYLSATTIKKFARSPRHYEHYITTPDERVSWGDFGNAFEIGLCDPAIFDERVFVLDDREIIEQIGGKRPTTTNLFKDWRAEQMEIAGDRYVIPAIGPESKHVMDQMIARCQDDDMIMALVTNTEYQSTCCWTENGVRIKTRPDVCNINRRVLVDIKTDRDGSPDGFSRSVTKLDYPLSAAVQCKGATATGLLPSVDAFFYLVAEKEPPFNVQLYRLNSEDIGMATAVLDHYIELFRKYQSGGLRLGYNFNTNDKHGVIDVNVPPYYWTKKGW